MWRQDGEERAGLAAALLDTLPAGLDSLDSRTFRRLVRGLGAPWSRTRADSLLDKVFINKDKPLRIDDLKLKLKFIDLLGLTQNI